MNFPIEPLFDRILVKKDEATTTSKGIHLPETVKGRAVLGTVVAVGPGQRTFEGKYLVPSVKVGDRVYVQEFSGYTLRYKDEEVYIFNENELIGIVRE